MVLCFACDSHTKAQLDELVAAGEYRDHSQAIIAAVANLAVLHSELRGRSSIVIQSAGTPHGGSEDRDAEPVIGGNPSGEANLARLDPTRPTPSSTENPNEVPEIFKAVKAHAGPSHLARLPPDAFAGSKTVPIDAWPFGQFNRLMPAKATCRALANIVATTDAKVPLERLSLDIATEAVALGRYLSKLDNRRGLARDDATATAFPKLSSPDAFKSVQRFANQFVGYATKDGELLGLPAALKLIGADPHNAGSITLSEAGWHFASLPNPLLDGLPAAKFQKFTDQETDFLLKHISNSVPAEAFAYRVILQEVTKGRLTPDQLDGALATLFRGSRKISAPFISTQRSGVISRMADLDLIGRSRSATRVSYVVTPKGKEFLLSHAP